MKIEFTDDARLTALVTRGWRHKRYAEVHQEQYGWQWRFTDTEQTVPNWLGNKLDRAQGRSHWRPVPEVPEARVVTRT